MVLRSARLRSILISLSNPIPLNNLPMTLFFYLTMTPFFLCPIPITLQNRPLHLNISFYPNLKLFKYKILRKMILWYWLRKKTIATRISLSYQKMPPRNPKIPFLPKTKNLFLAKASKKNFQESSQSSLWKEMPVSTYKIFKLQSNPKRFSLEWNTKPKTNLPTKPYSTLLNPIQSNKIFKSTLKLNT